MTREITLPPNSAPDSEGAVAGGWWQFPVGGGIVAQSDPDAELQETWHKAEGLLRGIESSLS